MNEKIVYKKVIPVGSVKENNRTYTGSVEVELKHRGDGFLVLTICGEVRDSSLRRDPVVMGGQCLDDMMALMPGKKLAEIRTVWKRWHLNDMHAGCEHQRAYENEPYEKHAREVCPICGYEYGTEWKREQLPQSIIDQVKSW